MGKRRRNHKGLIFIQDALDVIQAEDRTRKLRDRLLQGDAKAAALLRYSFHLAYWEYRGQPLLPRDARETGPGMAD